MTDHDRTWSGNIITTIVYMICTGLYFWPIFPHFSTALIGPPEDNMQFMWFIWYGSQAILRPEWPLMHTHMMYFPEGIDLFYANYYYVGVFVSVFLHAIFNYVMIYNLLILASFVLSGLGAYWLIRYLGGGVLASLVGGFIFAFNPSHFAHALHHVTISSIQFIPLFILFLIKALRRNKIQDILCCALFFILCALSDWNYFVYALFFMFIIYLYRLYRWRGKEALRDLMPLGAISFIGCAALSYWLIPMIWQGFHTEFAINIGYKIFVADLTGFFVPHENHLLAALSWIQKLRVHAEMAPWEKIVYLGLVNIVLVAVFLVRRPKENLKYVAAILLFMLFSLGSTLFIFGHDVKLALPYAFFEKIPFIKNARNPGRMIVFSYLFLAVLAAKAIDWMNSWKPSSFKKIILTASLIFIFLDYFSVNYAMTELKLPPVYQVILNESKKGDFAIFDVPYDYGRYNFYQTVHEIPNVQGYIGRKTNKTLIDRLPPGTANLPVQKIMLKNNKVKYLLIHKRRLTYDPTKPKDIAYEQILTRMSAGFAKAYDKIYEDADVTLFRVYKD